MPYVSFITAGKVHRLKPLAKDGRCKHLGAPFQKRLHRRNCFPTGSSFHDNANVCMKLNGCFTSGHIVLDDK